jgi:hypothetical protein
MHNFHTNNSKQKLSRKIISFVVGSEFALYVHEPDKIPFDSFFLKYKLFCYQRPYWLLLVSINDSNYNQEIRCLFFRNFDFDFDSGSEEDLDHITVKGGSIIVLFAENIE